MAADGWAQIGGIYDDRLSEIAQYRALATMAQAAEHRAITGKPAPASLAHRLESMAHDAERRLAGVRALGDSVTIPDPWPAFVREIARCCREVGLSPTVTGRVYRTADAIAPTWFQKFMAALDKNLLGSRKLVWTDHSDNQFERDHSATYAGVAKAMSGRTEAGKSRK